MSKNRAKAQKAQKAQKGKAPPPEKATTKKAFDLRRDSVYAPNPLELRICGAKGVVPDDEAGPLDTPPSEGMSVKDMRRMREALKPQFVQSIFLHGVDTPIVIGKIDGVPTVLAGKKRVRGARKADRQRQEEGLPPIRVRCVMKRKTDKKAIQALVIRENNCRTDDTLADKIEKLRDYLEDGPSEADAAIEFGVDESRIREWIRYDDGALPETKAAVDAGQIPASTGMELAKIAGADAQRAALAKILGGAGTRDRSARAARALARGADGRPTATDRKSQHLLLAHLQGAQGMASSPASRGPTYPGEFWRGVVEALKAVTGQEADPRVTQAIAEARSSQDPPDAPAPI